MQSLAVDVLYRLEMYHPVIDGVGVFSQEGVNGINHDLLFFQVSISSYDDHPMIWNCFPIHTYTKICIKEIVLLTLILQALKHYGCMCMSYLQDRNDLAILLITISR